MVADSRVMPSVEIERSPAQSTVVRPSEALRSAMKPTPLVLFMRTFFLYQLWRFMVVNLRMMKMILKSHG